ncbi:decapping endonuclease targeting mRNA [Polyrhizophydium stewartii]|uniref:Extracellular metalloproteinase n=1 Tax=Polyrhizophydium stewartii TaxID=2732419 RepID=A0ABR4N6I1_9FUNG
MRASFSLALALAATATTVLAAPATSDALQRRADGKLPFHFPKSVYETVAPTGRASFGKVSEAKAVKIATDFLAAKLGLAADEFKVYNSFTDASGTTHVYGAQQANGVRIANHQAAAHVQNGHVVSFSSSFNTDASTAKPRIPPMSAKLSVRQAIAKAVEDTGIPHHADFAAVPEYVNTGSGIVFAHKFQLRDTSKGQWVQVWVDANTGEIVHSADFVNKFSYKAIQLPKISPLDGFTTIVDPENAKASPGGWSTTGNSTKGNNAEVAKRNANYVAQKFGTGVNSTFDSAWNATKEPWADENFQASAVNLFYIANVMHDISYQYGFTEAAGNFQTDNFGRGGLGNDSVIVSVQDGHMFNNADFMTPTDGQQPRMRMFIYKTANPRRDGGLDATIVAHEYTHGISNRLTGGKATGQCLETDLAGGMGEGWSDFVSMVVTAKVNDTAEQGIPHAAYANNEPNGNRDYVYSTNLKTNPLTYSELDQRFEVHDIGQVWVEMLWEMYWNLVTKYGFNANMYDAKSTSGNVVALQLVIGGFMHQPCNPDLVQARDAILTADQTYYNGKYKCDIWKGFAKRGLGKNATSDAYEDQNNEPAECEDPAAPKPPAPKPKPKPKPCGTFDICCIFHIC